jgi:hypothetical protein
MLGAPKKCPAWCRANKRNDTAGDILKRRVALLDAKPFPENQMSPQPEFPV